MDTTLAHTKVRSGAGPILLLISLFITTIGTTASLLTFISYVFEQTGSPFNMGLTTLMSLLSGLFVAPFIGYYVKRIGVLAVVYIPEFISGLLIVLIPLITSHYYIYLVSFLLGINSQAVGICRMTIVAMFLEQERLMQFNSLLRGLNRLAMVIGALIYGLLITKSILLLFYFDTATYLISGSLLLALSLMYKKRPELDNTESGNTSYRPHQIISQLLKGYRILFFCKDINFIVILGMFIRVFYMSLNILLLIFIKSCLALSDKEFGYLMSFSNFIAFLFFIGVGSLIGKRKVFSRVDLIIIVNFVLYGLFIASIGFVTGMTQLYIVFSLAQLVFFANVMIIHSFIQSHIPVNDFPLASGAVGPCFAIGSMLSLAIFPLLAEFMEVKVLFVICGLGISTCPLLLKPGMKAIERRISLIRTENRN